MNIGFIGAGKVGRALGLYFKKHSLDVVGFCSRTLKSAQEAAQITNTDCFDSIEKLIGACDLIFITTSDHALTDVDKQVSILITNQSNFLHKVWIHTSGAFPSNCLTGIKSAGCPVGSMHPLQSFGDPIVSADLLEKTFFSIEGTRQALNAIKDILHQTGGIFNEISADLKPLYHAGACVISNYLVTLIDCGMRLMEVSGMDRDSLFQAIRPLISGTLKNIQEKGPVDALTGPIVRGDYDTISVQLNAIESKLPGETEIYRGLALRTVSMVEGEKLDHEQAKIFWKLLKGSVNNGQ